MSTTTKQSIAKLLNDPNLEPNDRKRISDKLDALPEAERKETLDYLRKLPRQSGFLFYPIMTRLNQLAGPDPKQNAAFAEFATDFNDGLLGGRRKRVSKTEFWGELAIEIARRKAANKAAFEKRVWNPDRLVARELVNL